MKGLSFINISIWLRQGLIPACAIFLFPFRRLTAIAGTCRRKLLSMYEAHRQRTMVFQVLDETGLSGIFIQEFYAIYKEKLIPEFTPERIRHFCREYLELRTTMYPADKNFYIFNRSARRPSWIPGMSEFIEFTGYPDSLPEPVLYGNSAFLTQVSSRELSAIFEECRLSEYNRSNFFELLFLLVFVWLASLVFQPRALAGELRKYRFLLSRQLSFAMITGRPSLANSPPVALGM